MIQRILVLGGGSAGYIAALTMKLKLPNVSVTVLHSSKLGIIGVGEGTTFTIPNYLHGYLGIDPKQFHTAVQPTYKLGIRFLWGPRPYFNYTFTNQLDARYQELPKPNGYYCDDVFDYADITSALMAENRAFETQDDGGPLVTTSVAYHLENKQFVEFLEKAAREVGIEIVDDMVSEVELNDDGVKSLKLESGKSLDADFYIDCSGFRSELIGRAFEEPFIDFKPSLWCDKAVVGGWARTDEPLYPYTTAETMDAGWCWQIEHDQLINRGYVYSSDYISDEEAEEEFRRKNPKVDKTRVVPFTSGRYRNAWVKNAVAIGNSAGFVEPLEATAIAVICDHCATLVRGLRDSDMQIKESQAAVFNKYNANNWDAIRKFLALHYKFNNRIDSKFWKDVQRDVDLAGAEDFVKFYQENGPSIAWVRMLIGDSDPFGWEGYLTMMVGQQVPYDKTHAPLKDDWEKWEVAKSNLKKRVETAMPQEQALEIIRSDSWQWRPDFYPNASQW